MLLTGVDVSKWQGSIDWGAAKQDIDFAILKAGGSDAGFYEDAYFKDNYKECKKYGIPVGCYYFVGKHFGDQEGNGFADARRFYDIIKGKTFEFPIYIDIEITPTDAKAREGTTREAISMVKTLEAAGYYVGIYGSDIATFKNRLNYKDISDIDIWVAKYSQNPPAWATRWRIWQYSSSGTVSGINGRVDLNRCNTNFPYIMKTKGLNGYGKILD